MAEHKTEKVTETLAEKLDKKIPDKMPSENLPEKPNGLSLVIYQAKPNPAGKGRALTQPELLELLLGEWVDIENNGVELITFSSIQLHHTIFNELCQTRGETQKYWSAEGNGLLKPGQILRVHSGRHQDRRLMSDADEADADWHAYAERSDFVLNSHCGEVIVLTWHDEDGREYKDVASYAPHPPEDAILMRSGNQLIQRSAG
jgi:hypothetical protein